MDFARIFTISFVAKSMAAIAVAVLATLGYYSDAAAYLMAWVPRITPEIARLVFWGIAAIMTLLLVVLWWKGRKHQSLWAERDQLELSAIACLSVGKKIDQPYDIEPQLSRHRLLKDAIRKGTLQYIDIAGEKPNVHTLVSREQLREYAKATNNADLLALLARWDKINPVPQAPSTSNAITLQGQQFPPATITQYLPSSAPAILFKDGWILNYNPKQFAGRKIISFLANGKIGEGRNPNEATWSMVGSELEIRRENGAMQNRFRFDPQGVKFISINHPEAKGLQDQFIFRDQSVK